MGEELVDVCLARVKEANQCLGLVCIKSERINMAVAISSTSILLQSTYRYCIVIYPRSGKKLSNCVLGFRV